MSLFNKIKIAKNIEVKVELKENKLNIQLIDKKHLSTDISTLNVSICEACGGMYFTKYKQNNLCEVCDQMVTNYINKSKELKGILNSIKDNTINIKPKQKRAFHHRVNYKKQNYITNNIKINNLNELHKSIPYYSYGKLATLLKCAIMKMSIKEISNKLDLLEQSVIRDYTRLEALNFVVKFGDSYRVTNNIDYTIFTENNAVKTKNNNIKMSNYINKNKTSAYNYISQISKDWFTIKEAVDKGYKYKTINCYIYVLKNVNLIDKKVDNKITYFKLKEKNDNE